jgi:hypothetical protein
MIERLRELYEKYAVEGLQERKRSIGDAFRGWFSGRGKDPAPVDVDFMNEVAECAEQIRSSGNGNDAFEAARIILSLPRSKKFSQRDLVFAAIHSRVTPLVPLLDAAQRGEVLKLMEEVPKAYRFPVYKELKQALLAAEQEEGSSSGNG